jgi:hypothetical protein
MATVGEQWVAAIATRDRPALTALLADAVDFRGVTPRKAWEAMTPAEVVDVVLGTWFDDGVRIDAVEQVEQAAVADTRRVGYRFRTTTGDGPHLIEQQAYFRTDGQLIDYLRIACSGYRPVS